MESAITDYLKPHLNLLQDASSLSVLLATTVAIFSLIYYITSYRHLPPGPTGFPFLGLWPILKNDTLHFQLHEYQKKYGDLYSFNHGGVLYLNMGSAKVMKDIHLTKADCFERISTYNFMKNLFDDGVAFLNGEAWKVQRKFTLQQLRELGMTTVKENLTGPIYESIRETLAYLRSQNGEPVEIIQMLTNKCNAILRRTLFGDQSVTEQEVQEINESYGEVIAFMTMENTLLAGSFAKFILPLKSGYKNAVKHHKNMRRILLQIVNRHKTNFDEQNPRNYVDAFFIERNKRRAKGDPTAEYFTENILVSNLHQLVGDGVLGVSSFVSAFLKYVVDNAEEQEKIYAELVEVIGQDRDPSIEDKNKLIYTNALILEVLRISDFFPVFASQQCIKECTVNGYRIPKGAITLMNNWGCHQNPSVYDEPEKFNPSRFLPQEGKAKPELPVTFGIGKRSCIGESFAMAQTFLFLTTIIKNFKLSIPKNDRKGVSEILLTGKMEVCAVPRT